MAGIEDVAKLAGVSTATVSRALTGKAHVSAKTRALVNAAAKELDYVASSSAYTLATGRNRNVGVVLPYIDRWYFSAILEAIDTTFAAHGYDLTIYNLSGGRSHRDSIFSDFLLRKRVDGVLTVAVALSESELESLSRVKKPILVVGGVIPGTRSMTIDDAGAAKLATNHLISLGHKKIGNITGMPASDLEFNQPNVRHEGYLSALAEAGLEAAPHWQAQADYTLEGAYHAAKQILGSPKGAPTAIFCNSDEMGFGAILAAKDLGLRVPDDVSIIGFDNHDNSEFFGLTTVDQKTREQGVHAAKLLLDVLANSDASGVVNIDAAIEWPTELKIRSSTSRPK